MRGCGRDRQPFAIRRVRGRVPQRGQRRVDFGDRLADVRVRFEDGREQLGLEPARQLEALDTAQDAVDGRDLVERGRVEDHQFLLDTERERRRLAEVLFDQWVLTPCTGRPAATQA